MAVILRRPQSPTGQRWRWIAPAVAMLLLAFVTWNWSRWIAAAEVGAAYGARVICSCRYVEGRPAESCKGDMRAESGMGLVSIGDDAEAKAVTGHVWLMARRTARLKPGFGCILDPL